MYIYIKRRKTYIIYKRNKVGAFDFFFLIQFIYLLMFYLNSEQNENNFFCVYKKKYLYTHGSIELMYLTFEIYFPDQE